MVKFSFMPRQEKFFNLFEESARNIVKASRVFKEMVDSWEMVGGKVAEITELEHEGDSIVHKIMEQLHRTFVTPFDREDMSALAHVLDDVIDCIHAAADAMFIYKISEPTQPARELADIIVQGADEIEKAVEILRRHSDLKQIHGHCVEMNRLENMADRVFRAGMAELFDDTSDITLLIKWREIYEHMEGATDRCEDVADILEGVALKHA
ncbi:DUF47 domain-containing protein [Chloroflexota bacterium]